MDENESGAVSLNNEGEKEKYAAQQVLQDTPQDTGADDAAKKAIAREYPEYLANGELKLPDDVKTLVESGMTAQDACRAADLKRTKALCSRLTAKLDAIEANKANAASSIGSLSGGGSPGKDYFTSKEWDALPQGTKQKFIKSGKIYEFMRKWSGK